MPPKRNRQPLDVMLPPIKKPRKAPGIKNAVANGAGTDPEEKLVLAQRGKGGRGGKGAGGRAAPQTGGHQPSQRNPR